jgi:hypothetical protein
MGRTGIVIILVLWHIPAKVFRSAQDQFSTSMWCFPHGWQPLDKLFSPENRPYTQLKLVVGIPEMNQKGEPRAGY